MSEIEKPSGQLVYGCFGIGCGVVAGIAGLVAFILLASIMTAVAAEGQVWPKVTAAQLAQTQCPDGSGSGYPRAAMVTDAPDAQTCDTGGGTEEALCACWPEGGVWDWRPLLSEDVGLEPVTLVDFDADGSKEISGDGATLHFDSDDDGTIDLNLTGSTWGIPGTSQTYAMTSTAFELTDNAGTARLGSDYLETDSSHGGAYVALRYRQGDVLRVRNGRALGDTSAPSAGYRLELSCGAPDCVLSAESDQPDAGLRLSPQGAGKVCIDADADDICDLTAWPTALDINGAVLSGSAATFNLRWDGSIRRYEATNERFSAISADGFQYAGLLTETPSSTNPTVVASVQDRSTGVGGAVFGEYLSLIVEGFEAFRADVSGATVNGKTRMEPETSAVACTLGDLYVDDSGALCGCNSAGAWEIIHDLSAGGTPGCT